MDTLLIFWWGVAALIIILFQDPNVPAFIELQFRRCFQAIASWYFSQRLAFSLALTRRSFRNDWIGRRLRDYELRAIQRNPAYRELFDGSLGAQRGSKEEH